MGLNLNLVSSVYQNLTTQKDDNAGKANSLQKHKMAESNSLQQNYNVSVSVPSKRFDLNSSLQEVLSGTKELKIGSKGDDVKLVQTALTDMGFYNGDKADGKFGKQTAIALKNFQSNRQLPQTGILDQKTMQELNKVAPAPEKKLWDKPNIAPPLKTDMPKPAEVPAETDSTLPAEVPAETDSTLPAETAATGEITEPAIIPSNKLENGKNARIIVDLSEHRLFFYNQDNSINKIYSIASGKDDHTDGRGGKTQTGLKKINYKDNDPTKTAAKLWPESKGKAFGTKLLDLSWVDSKTGKKTASGEEIHGTFTRTSIGTDASHGCMRMLNEEVEELFSQVKTGDLVKIQE